MEYITLEQSFRNNAHRHLERAIAYASAGYPNRFYEGSMRKALRNFKKADELHVDGVEWGILKIHPFMFAHYIAMGIFKC